METQKSKSRLKLFLENILVFGFGGAISKLIPFLMLPLVTRLLPETSYFGINDISVIIISFGQAIAVMGMYDAMFRMFFEKEEMKYKRQICSTALWTVTFNVIIIAFVYVVLRKELTKLFFSDTSYELVMLLSFLGIIFSSFNLIFSAPTRMENRRRIYLSVNILSPVISYSIALIMLIKGQFLLALPFANCIASMFLLIFYITANHKWFSFGMFKSNYLKQMLLIAVPLVPNVLLYWIFNSCDRLMISYYLGMEANGVYAAGAKIGQVSQLIYTAFAGGWQYFAFSTMKDDDQVGLISNIFECLGIVTFVASIGMCIGSQAIFKILFPEAYYSGFIVTPYLFAAPLFLMLFQTAGNQLLVVKKTWLNLLVLALGAAVNIGLNWMLIQRTGIEGAAIGTFLGYVVIVAGISIILSKMKLIKISKKFMVATLIYFIFWFFWRKWGIGHSVIFAGFAGMILILYIWLYSEKIRSMKSLIFKK